MASDAKEEIYKYVRDRHDKLLTARSMAQTRVGHLLILTGFVISALVSTGMPHLLPAFEHATHPAGLVVSGFALVALITTFVFIGMLVFQLGAAVSRFAFAIPDAWPNVIRANIRHPKLTTDELFPELTDNYLDAIEANGREAGKMGKHLNKSLWNLYAALIAGAIFIGMLLAARITVAITSPTRGEVKRMLNQSSQSGPVNQGQSQPPAVPVPAVTPTPAATPTSETPRPPMNQMGIQMITGSFAGQPNTKGGGEAKE